MSQEAISQERSGNCHRQVKGSALFNSGAEPHHSWCRHVVLDCYVFKSLHEAKRLTEDGNATVVMKLNLSQDVT